MNEKYINIKQQRTRVQTRKRRKNKLPHLKTVRIRCSKKGLMQIFINACLPPFNCIAQPMHDFVIIIHNNN